MDENHENALSSSGGVMRRDMFKGYTPAQIQRLLRDNETMLKNKRSNQDEAKKSEMIWRLQQDIARKGVEQLYLEEKLIRQEQEMDRQKELKQQIVQQENYRKQDRENSFGVMTNDFFNHFGSSCR